MLPKAPDYHKARTWAEGRRNQDVGGDGRFEDGKELGLHSFEVEGKRSQKFLGRLHAEPMWEILSNQAIKFCCSITVPENLE
jgi:hypothetical protein